MMNLTILSFNAQRMTYATSKATTLTSADNNSIQTRLSCLLEGLPPHQRDQHREQVLRDLNLQKAESIPLFDETTQTVSRLLAMPICILSIVDADLQHFKSAVGLSSLGLMNQLAAARSIPRQESFCTHVIDSGKTFALEDATAHSAFSHSLLVHQYGIQSYLGVPLLTAEGICIGTLAVMDLLPHAFTQQEIACLELSARWCMSELEKQHLHSQLQHPSRPTTDPGAPSPLLSKINQVRFDLVVQLTQDLRNPLTSITGMANMLSREIYGPLSEKQQEYAKIVLNSSQHLLTMVDEIVEVGDLKENDYQLAVATVDIEMLVQQAIASLNTLAKQQDLQIKLTVEPGSRLWNLDKRIIKQLIYHLVFSIIKLSTAGSTIRLHVSRKENSISLALWVSNPWLGEDLPPSVIAWGKSHTSRNSAARQPNPSLAIPLEGFAIATTAPSPTLHPESYPESTEDFVALANAQKADASRQELGLLLSRHLTKMHGGEALVQGSAATGHRYIITLPSLALPN
jgi:signal transduction histidine kinase